MQKILITLVIMSNTSSSKKSSIKQEGESDFPQWAYLAIYIIIILGGFISIVIGEISFPGNSILVGAGTAFITSGIIAIITHLTIGKTEKETEKRETEENNEALAMLKKMEEDNKKMLNKLTFASDWGLRQVHPERIKHNEKILELKESYWIIAYGLTGLQKWNTENEKHPNIFEDLAKSGKELKFLVARPFTPLMEAKDDDERTIQKGLRYITSAEICGLYCWVSELRDLAKEKVEDGIIKELKVDLKFYPNLPQDYFCRIDNDVFFGISHICKMPSNKTITYETSIESLEGQQYLEHFAHLWNDAFDAFDKDTIRRIMESIETEEEEFDVKKCNVSSNKKMKKEYKEEWLKEIGVVKTVKVKQKYIEKWPIGLKIAYKLEVYREDLTHNEERKKLKCTIAQYKKAIKMFREILQSDSTDTTGKGGCL